MAKTMRPRLRKLALTTHVAFSVGLLGSIATFLSLAIVALTSQDAQMVRASYLAMDVVARLVIVPLAFASLLTGLVQSLGTSWGLLRHYWVLAKLSITALATIVLLAKMELIGYAAGLAAETILPRADLRVVGIELAVHAAGGLLVLLVPTALSIYKPRGLTPYGQRMQQQQRTPLYGAAIPSQQGAFLEANRVGGGLNVESITITLRRAHVLGIVVVVLVLHFFILHFTGIGLRGH